mgnify:CR=1 FL=1
MTTPYKGNYGYGFVVSKDSNMISHTGKIDKYNAALAFTKDENQIYIALSNYSNSSPINLFNNIQKHLPRFTVNFRLLITKNQNLHKMYCYSALIELSILLRRLFLCQMYLSVPQKMHAPKAGEQTNGCEPVCINVSRIYDSCGAKDCLSNLPVMFTEANQKIIDGACSVKISNVRIITSTVEVEPVAFHRALFG